MAIAVYASKTFEVNTDKIYTFDDFQCSAALQTEKQDVENSKPSTYIKGADLETMNFKLKLDIAFGINPRREWEEWKEIMNAAKAYPFILGNKPYGGNWLLVSVGKSNVQIDNSGNILALELDLKFDEYVRQGTAKDKEKGKGKSKKKKEKEVSSLDEAEMDLLID